MRSETYKNYLLGILTVIGVFNFLDRVALGLLLQNIKTDLSLTDTQLGLLSGIAFAFFYSIMGIPIARWADRGNRVAIIALSTLLWSIAVALCGAAETFIQLLLIRVVVAIGEAGCTPPALSLLADYFSRAERPRTTAIYGMSAPLSTFVGFFLAGRLSDLYGWRATFALLGVPGLLLATVAWRTLEEPRRTGSLPQARSAGQPFTVSAPVAQQSLREVCAVLWRNATFRHLLLCISVMLFFCYGIFLWLPAFFIRTYGMATDDVGKALALTWGLGGLIGAYLGGELASRCAANKEQLQLKAISIAIACSGLLSVAAYLGSHRYAAFILTGLSTLGLATVNGPLLATLQTLVAPRMRAMAVAIVYLFSNLIGMGLGPLAAGALSDGLRGFAGGESLRYALLILAPGYVWSAWHAWRAGSVVVRDLAAVQSDRATLSYSEPDRGGELLRRGAP